jgi:hypothetical protein
MSDDSIDACRVKTTRHALVPHNVGLLFDFAGFYPASVHRALVEKRKLRPRNVDEAMRRDVSAIAADMRGAMDKWAADHA